MASTKRLLKERAQIARNPIPYVTFNDDDGDDDKMSDGGDANISEWRFILALDPAHDSLDEPSLIGTAAASPYCCPPPSAAKKGGGLLGGVARAAKTKKAGDGPSRSSSGGPAYFAFQLDFPASYPFRPPAITVLTSSYHPNVHGETGAMCDDVLTGDGWGPTLNVRKICMRLRKFLCHPDPDHPLDSVVAQLLVDREGEYRERAFRFAREFGTRGVAEDAMRRGKRQKK